MSMTAAAGHAAAYSIRHPAPPRPESFVRFAGSLARDMAAGLVRAVAGGWRSHRDLAALQFASDRMLADLGLGGDDFRGGISSPRWSCDGRDLMTASLRRRDAAISAAGRR